MSRTMTPILRIFKQITGSALKAYYVLMIQVKKGVTMQRLIELKIIRRCCLVLVLALLVSAWSEETKPQSERTPVAPGISIDAQRQNVHLDAAVCLGQGILEFLICKKHTFEHESVFATEAQASRLHAALLLIGADPNPMRDLNWFATARAHSGAHIKIMVAYEHDEKKHLRPVSDFITNREQADGIIPDAWVFTGSGFYIDEGKEYYIADVSGAVVSIVPKGTPVIQLGELLGMPYQGDEMGTEINKKDLPPVGTNVTLIFTIYNRAEKRAENKAVEQSTQKNQEPSP